MANKTELNNCNWHDNCTIPQEKKINLDYPGALSMRFSFFYQNWCQNVKTFSKFTDVFN